MNRTATAATILGVFLSIPQASAQTATPGRDSAVKFLNEVAQAGALVVTSVADTGEVKGGGPVTSVSSKVGQPCSIQFYTSGLIVETPFGTRKSPTLLTDGKITSRWPTEKGQDEYIAPARSARVFKALNAIQSACAVQIESGTGF
jgi:hypothetical protein